MTYKRIMVELIVVANESEAVIADLNASLDQLEEKWTIFGGGIEVTAVRHQDANNKSALSQTNAATETLADAVRAARDRVAMAPCARWFSRRFGLESSRRLPDEHAGIERMSGRSTTKFSPASLRHWIPPHGLDES